MPRTHRRKRAPVSSQQLGNRGLATRERLKAAAGRVLARKSYNRMTVADVTREAGVAAGLFHRYFPDLQALTQELLQEVIDGLGNTAAIERGLERGDWMGRIHSHIAMSVANHAQQPGLVRAMNQLAEESPAFRSRLRTFYQSQLELLSTQLPRMFPASRLTAAEALLVVYALGGISEAVLRERYLLQNPVFRDLSLSPAELADWLAVLFYRALFAANPPPDPRRKAARLLALGAAKPRGSRPARPK
jgi:AcrR family transcriptional regulator